MFKTKSVPNIDEEKAINYRRFGFIFAFLIFMLISLFFFATHCIGIVITLFILGALQIILFFISPKYYIFSKERLIIKYSFSLKENIPWQNVKSIVIERESPVKYFYLDSYEIYYFPKVKCHFFMRGLVNKNKKTTALFEKYYSKKI